MDVGPKKKAAGEIAAEEGWRIRGTEVKRKKKRRGEEQMEER